MKKSFYVNGLVGNCLSLAGFIIFMSSISSLYTYIYTDYPGSGYYPYHQQIITNEAALAFLIIGIILLVVGGIYSFVMGIIVLCNCKDSQAKGMLIAAGVLSILNITPVSIGLLSASYVKDHKN